MSLKKQKWFALSPPKGFSLIEALVSIGIMAVIGVILSDLLIRGFQGNSKTQIIGVIKQNGQVALSNMEDVIKNADAVVCPDSITTNSQIITVAKANTYTRFWLKPGTTQNGSIMTDSFDGSMGSNSPCSLDGAGSPNNPPPSNMVSLTNTDLTTGVDVSTLTFTTKSSATGDAIAKDVVEIIFSVKPGKNAGKGFANLIGGTGEVPFQTSIQLR